MRLTLLTILTFFFFFFSSSCLDRLTSSDTILLNLFSQWWCCRAQHRSHQGYHELFILDFEVLFVNLLDHVVVIEACSVDVVEDVVWSFGNKKRIGCGVLNLGIIEISRKPVLCTGKLVNMIYRSCMSIPTKRYWQIINDRNWWSWISQQWMAFAFIISIWSFTFIISIILVLTLLASRF